MKILKYIIGLIAERMIYISMRETALASSMNYIPVWEKLNITIEEAANYSGIGIHKIRELMKEKDCDFVLKIGNKKNLIKRVKFEKYILAHEAI